MQEYRALLCWTQEQLRECEVTLTSMAKAIFDAWGCDAETSIDFRCQLLSESTNLTLTNLSHIPDQAFSGCGIWILPQNKVRQFIQTELFGISRLAAESNNDNPVANELVETVLSEYWRSVAALAIDTSLQTELSDTQSVLPDYATCIWSGYVHVRCDLLNLDLIFSPEIVHKIAGGVSSPKKSNKPLFSLEQAVFETPISLHLKLAPLVMDLDAIQTLQTGDVILLPHALADPIKIESDDKNVYFSAYLGKQNDRLGIELVPNKK